MFAGLPLVLCGAEGPGRIALSFDHSGEIVAVPLAAGAGIVAQEHHFLAASSSITYDYRKSPVWYRTRNGDETETHYPVGMYLDDFTAEGESGIVLIHAKGNVYRRELAVGEQVLVKGTAFLYADPSVSMAPASMSFCSKSSSGSASSQLRPAPLDDECPCSRLTVASSRNGLRSRRQ